MFSNNNNNNKDGQSSTITANITVQEGGHIDTVITAHTVNQTIMPPSPADHLPTIWGKPPLENKHFFLSKNLERVFLAFESSQAHCVVALVGLGGVGKTELAKHYFYHYKKKYTSAIWFTANNRQDLELEYRYLAKELKLTIEDEDIALIKRKIFTYLKEHPGWLLVLDNADDISTIQSLLPPQGGDILITSRQPLDNATQITIEALEDDEAIHFYQNYTQEQDTDIIKQLVVDKLAGLFLAIAQAAAYVNRIKTTDTRGYLADFNQFQNELLNINKLPISGEDTVAEKNRLTVATTWNISLKAIEKEYLKEGHPNYASVVLQICSYMSYKNIPIDFVHKVLEIFYSNKNLKLLLNEALDKLQQHSLIKYDKTFIHIHKLVQDVNRGKPQEDYKLISAVAQALSELFVFKRYNVDETTYLFTLLPHCEEFTKHVRESPSNFQYLSLIKLNMANAYSILNDWENTIRIIEENLHYYDFKIDEKYVCHLGNSNKDSLFVKLIEKSSHTYCTLFQKTNWINYFKRSLLLLKVAKTLNEQIHGKSSSQVAINLCYLALLIKSINKKNCSAELIDYFDEHFSQYQIRKTVETRIKASHTEFQDLQINIEKVIVRMATEAFHVKERYFNNQAAYYLTDSISENAKQYTKEALKLINSAMKQISSEDDHYEVFIVVRALGNSFSRYDPQRFTLLQSAMQLGLLIYGENSLIIAETKIELAECEESRDVAIDYYIDALKIVNDILKDRDHHIIPKIIYGLRSLSKNLLKYPKTVRYQNTVDILLDKLNDSDLKIYISCFIILARVDKESLANKLKGNSVLKEKIMSQLVVVNSYEAREIADYFIEFVIKIEEPDDFFYIYTLSLLFHPGDFYRRLGIRLLSSLSDHNKLPKLPNCPQRWLAEEGRTYAACWLANHGVFNYRIETFLASLLGRDNRAQVEIAVHIFLQIKIVRNALIKKLFDQIYYRVKNLNDSIAVLVYWNMVNKNVFIYLIELLKIEAPTKKSDFRFSLASILLAILKKDNKLNQLFIEKLSTQAFETHSNLVKKLIQINTFIDDEKRLIQDLADPQLIAFYKIVYAQFVNESSGSTPYPIINSNIYSASACDSITSSKLNPQKTAAYTFS